MFNAKFEKNVIGRGSNVRNNHMLKEGPQRNPKSRHVYEFSQTALKIPDTLALTALTSTQILTLTLVCYESQFNHVKVQTF